MGELFRRGYEPVREEKKRQEARQENFGKRLNRFFLLKDGDEADIRFLTEEPINCYMHSIKVNRNGKERYADVVCTGDDSCPYCQNDNPSFVGAFLIIDKRPYTTTDKNGKEKKVEEALRLYIAKTKILSQLDRLSSKYGLVDREYTVARTGTGQSTSYSFDRGDNLPKISRREIENLLPEKLREDYDGTMNSLYSIVEHQLTMMLPDGSEYAEEENENEDDEMEEKTSFRNLISSDDDEEEEEEERPRKVTPSVKKRKLLKR